MPVALPSPRRTLVLLGIGGLLLASNRAAGPLAPPDPSAGSGRVALDLPSFDDRAALPGARARLSLLHWNASAGAGARMPVLCLHGSPGSARNFERLAPRLAADGRPVWALDLPGFGRSDDPHGGRSIVAHARAALAALEALGLERVHVVAWSMGGGVALHMAELAPERIASLALLASIGVQETEGTGDHVAEQIKYAALRAGVEVLDHGLPHFGRWSPVFADAREFARNFQETDQRPLRGILGRLSRPLLVVHGAGDVLASARAAWVSHELVGDSRLVLLDGNHFLPFTHVDELEGELAPFFARHDRPGSREPRSQGLELEPRRGAAALDPWPFELGQRVSAYLQAAVWAAAGAALPLTASLAAGLALASLQFDPGWTLLALALGLGVGGLRRRRAAGALLGLLACLATWGVGAGAAAWLDMGAGRTSALGVALLALARTGLWRYRVRARSAEEGLRARTRPPRAPAPPP